MNARFIKSPVLLLFICFAVLHSSAQIGFKVSELSPYGDIGQYFNKGAAIDVYAVLKEGPWKERFGIFYSHLKPRIDTFPVYAVQSIGSQQTVIPGFLANHTLTFAYITGDLSHRIVQFKGFSLYGGAGIIAGKSHTEYDEVYTSVSSDHSNIDVLIAGFKLCGSLDYKISDHLHVYGEYTYNGIVATDWSTHYTNTLFSIGLDYSIKPFDDD